LFFAAGTALIYAYANYTECRCNQATPGPSVTIATCCSAQYGGYGTSNGDSRCCSSPKYWLSNFHNCYTPCSSVNCSGSTPTKNPSASYDEISPATGAPSGTGNCCMAAPPAGTIHIGGYTATAISAQDTDSIGPVVGGCTVTSSCQAYANSWKLSIPQCATTYTSGAACNPQGFTPCYLSNASFGINPFSSGGSASTGYCTAGGYTCAQSGGGSGLPCGSGCQIVGSGIYQCCGGSVCVTVGSGTAPQPCLIWHCMCNVVITPYVTCS